MTVPVGGEERGGGQQQVEHGVVPLHHSQLGSRVTNTVRDVHIRTNLGIEGNSYIKVSWAIIASNEGSRCLLTTIELSHLRHC